MDTVTLPRPDPLAVPRRRFTSAEVERMVQVGILSKDDHVELIHGELIEMGKQGKAHWRAVQALLNWFARRIPADVAMASQGPLRLADGEEPEPDLFLFPTSMDVNDVRGGDVIIAIEIADSSFTKDRQIKAPLYAAHGVREYWIVALEQRITLVFRLVNGAYGEPAEIAFDAPLTATDIAELLVIKNVI
jgi:Uma2 family endonuclease